MNFNTDPYYDDNDPNKNHMKVLFKPSYYVQARELNVLQSIVQNQIASVGNHLFKNNSKITGCSSAFVQYDYVRLNDVYNNQDVKLNAYDGLRVVGATSSVEANIIHITEKDVNDPPTLYVIYTKTGSDGEQSTFIAGEDISFYDVNNVAVYTATVRCPSCPNNTTTDLVKPLGKSMFFNIEAGVFYHNGYFVNNPQQKVVTEKYLNRDANGNIISTLTYRVGLDIVQEIVTASEDATLYDPHLNYPNYAAEGADRYKIDLTLSLRPYAESEDDTDFITLAKVRENQTVEYKKDDTEYAGIMDEISRRTYETSGNFTNIPWKARFLNEKKTTPTDPLGYSTDGKDENFTALISVGSGYVKGNRVENTNDAVVTGRKARDTKKLRGASASFLPIQNFVITSNHDVSWINHNGTSLLTNQIVNFVDATSSVIGSFRVYDVERIGSNSQYRLYVYGIQLLNGKALSMVKGVQTVDLSLSGTVSTMKLENSSNTSLLFGLGYESIKSLRSLDNPANGSINIYLKRRFLGVLDGNGSITFTTQSNEYIVDPAKSNPICWVGSNPSGVEKVLSSSDYVYNNTSLTLNLGSANAGKNVSFVTSILRTTQQEKTKTLTQAVYTTSAKPPSEIDSIVELPYADGYNIVSVQLINTVDNTVNIDVKHEYDFDDGQRDMFYENAKIVRNVQRSFDNNDRLVVTFQYFEHSGSQGYFTVDSYSQLVNDPTLNLEYSDIPTYRRTDGIVVRLAEVFDFRTIKNSDGSLDYNTPIVQFNSNASFDIEYYLSRCDLLQVSPDGIFYLKEGVSSENPTLPSPDPDSMALYEVYIAAYTYSMNDIDVKFIDNRKYTMKDIAKIENRVSNLENTVALSLLEMQTVNMSIKDSNGLDRYKNGFLVDNFKNFYGSDIANLEYNASLDRTSGQLRSAFKSNNIRLAIDEVNSKNLQTFGNIAIAKFDHELFITNPYATKSLSVNPYMVYRVMGSMSLSPNIDTWADNNKLPTIVANIDTGVEALKQVAEAAKVTSTDYGTWVDYNQSIVTSVSTADVTTNRYRAIFTTTTNTTTTDSARNVTTTNVGSQTQNYSIDDIVKDVSIIPYVREATIQFYATNLKPNTKVYAFFDNINVSEHCKKTQQVSSTGDVLVDRSQSVFGASPLITDANGNITGEFRIPANTFFVGEKKFVLTNDPNNTGNTDIETTRAESTYFAGGLSTTKQDFNMNVVSPTFNKTTTTETKSRTVTTSNTTHRTLWGHDPIAQGFAVDVPCFISKVDVYLASVDQTSDMLWFEIREMVNGYPSSTAINRKEVSISVLKDYVSDDASVPFTVVFPSPTYVDPYKTYAFVIGGYSVDTKVYCSTLGDKLLNSDNILGEPPLTYTMFRSLNGETWTAYQYDTMKINIYRCLFNTSDAVFAFKNSANVLDNQNAFLVSCDNDPIEVQVSSNKVRIHAKNHGLKEGDYATLTFDKDKYYTIEITSGMPQIDQPISTLTGSGYIKDIQITDTLNFYKISIRDTEGYFVVGQEITCEVRNYEYRDLFLISDTGASGVPITQNMASGYVRGITQDGVPQDISGADITLFTKKHIVRQVDTIDSFIVEVAGTFNTSGRFGGANAVIYNTNVKYDMFNVAGQFLTYDVQTDWSVSAQKYNDLGFASGITIKPQHDTYVEEPLVIYSTVNEKRLFNNTGNSFNMQAYCTLQSKYVSPVFNMDTFSITTISNRVDNISVNNNIDPNASLQYVAETDPQNGTEKFKHITTKVTLENPASDMKIIFDVFCPSNADFDVYVKLITAQNNVDDSTLNWMLLDTYTKQRFSNGVTDTIEYNLLASRDCSTWASTIEYIGFRVKLVGKSTNTSKPPFFQNLRVIAIT